VLAINVVPTDTLADAFTNPVIVVLPAANVVIPETAPAKDPVFALSTQRCVVVPNAVPTVFEDGLTPVPPDEVIPAVVIATLTDELPKDIVVALANNPLEVALIVPDPILVLKSPVLAESTNLPIELPNNIVFDVGAIAVVFATNPLVACDAALTIPV